MVHKTLAVLLIVLGLNLTAARPALAATKAEEELRFANKVRTGIGRLGTGPAARVELRLRDKTELKGYVREAGPESFVVVADNTGTPTTVAYPQVGRVKAHNLSTGVKIAIGVGILVALIILVITSIPET